MMMTYGVAAAVAAAAVAATATTTTTTTNVAAAVSVVVLARLYTTRYTFTLPHWRTLLSMNRVERNE